MAKKRVYQKLTKKRKNQMNHQILNKKIFKIINNKNILQKKKNKTQMNNHKIQILTQK